MRIERNVVVGSPRSLPERHLVVWEEEMSMPVLWKRYQHYLCRVPALGLTLDVSRMRFEEDLLERMAAPLRRAFEAMDALERGAIANPDEKRMVGHYWLRSPELAPKPELRRAIEETLATVRAFAADVHSGAVATAKGGRFTHALVVGIGGSALGPQFVADALTSPPDKMQVTFLDNTDPDGMDRALAQLGPALSETLTVVISKSGGTKETRNGMLELEAAYRRQG